MSSAVAVLLWLMVLAPATYSQSCENADAEVLILGAGISGISAAKTLHDNRITNFIILEQRDRIGGRLISSRFAGATIELGAQWIVSADPSAPLSMLFVWHNGVDYSIVNVGWEVHLHSITEREVILPTTH